ncbi:MAG: Bacterial HflC protein [Candidatus Falkowbacteria bacterium GW2011_GWF2_39_8]|uniref:Bacterial HflC protein n=1 Tax=Candidatus Falkowbacteria bacterium GW2011_GWF2_39_8 TaxID=1618642 RepID=A0A0G0PY69_9BACT|nr:MAG: Bacterial HflC protein [Candidatus Falkowbacteria bacterium GW2011_GWF2_39_8]
MNEKLKGLKWILIVVIGFIVITIINPFVLIGAGQRGIVMNFGAVQDKIMNEGIHFRIPIVQSVEKINVQTTKMEVKAMAYSKDIQTVESQLALNYHLKADVSNKLWQEVGADYESRIVDPSIQESVKAVTAKFTAQELIEQRAKVKDEIKNELFNRLSKYFVVDEFSIIDFSFSDEYEKAVEAKQVAQQSALKAENDLQRIKTEAAQRIAQAKAEAEAIKLQSDAANNDKYVNLKALEVQKSAVEKWNGVLPTQMIPNATLPFINLAK